MKRLEKWGIFASEEEVDKMVELVKERNLEVFEVRKLTFIEKLTYIKDSSLFLCDPYIIMFNATKREYKSLIKSVDLTPVF
jgi:N-dimethylarginine dimethylaminohydrolase